MSDDLKSTEIAKVPLQTVFINGNKISTLIPNRIFVGGFPQNTSEEDLKNFFFKYGEIKDVKIIPDKAGQAKGSYGFVTFESQEVAEKIITEQAETLVFRDRKLNIGRAVKKQPLTGKAEMQNTVILNTLPLPYGAVYPYQDYSYLFNQDLTSFYQNYSSQLSQMSMLPAYTSSLLSPFIATNETLGLSLNPYQQLQSLIPLSVATPSQNNSSFLVDATAYLTEQLSSNPIVSTDTPGSSDSSKTTDTVTISSGYKSYDTNIQPKSQTKTPFNTITNQVLNNKNSSSKFVKDEYELPKKKIKHEETNAVTKFSEPIHYLFPK